MHAPLDVAVLVGSLRKDAYSLKVARALIALAPPSLACRLVGFGDLPLYNEDLDATPPAAWTRFRASIRAADAVMFVTPEYNRSVPGGLKNAIDVGSRPNFPSDWTGLPAAVISVSPYKLGGFGANHHIRQSLVFLNMPVMQQPEAYIGDVTTIFGDNSGVAASDSLDYLRQVIEAFADWAALTGRRNSAAF
jgi:chromate reductase